MAADRRAVAEHRAVDHRLAVDGMGHRPAHTDVVEGRPRVVHREDRLALGRADDDLEPRIGGELREVLRGRVIREGVEIARHHRREGGRGIRDELEGDLLERGLLALVVLVAHQFDPVALQPVGEPERPGADRVGGIGLRARRRDDHRIAPGEVEEQRPLGHVETDLHRGIVDGRHLVDAVEELLLGIGRVHGHRPVEGKDHVLGGQGQAVMEGDTRRGD